MEMTALQEKEKQRILHRRERNREDIGNKIQTAQVTDMCRRKLLDYADTFQELAKSYDGGFAPGDGDRQTVLASRRLWESRQIIKGQWNEMARIMSAVAGEVMCSRPMEEKRKKTLIQVLREEGIRVENPCYMQREDGRESVVLTMSADRPTSVSGEDAAEIISAVLDRPFQLASRSPYVIEKEPRSFVLDQRAAYLALTGFARVTRENEKVSGDNYASVEPDKGRLAVMLSDGTGSGEQAGQDSGQVLDLMEKLLEAGYGADAAISAVNTVVFAAGEDRRHPTLDLCDIDLYQGSFQLRKVGGAASFFKRGAFVDTLATGNLPLGIFQRVETLPICRQLQDGDFLVMVTDGVVDAFGAEEYENGILRALSCMDNRNPEEFAQKLLRQAICAGRGRIRDDMTVAVIGIWDA